MKRNPKNRESGFALLLIFAMAAAVALLFYMQLPRLVFEQQRIREETLITRGEQYSRAIQMFVRRNKKYPQTIEELERFNDIRSLRQRYADPLTGKDEWRLIHADGAGRLTDSLNNANPDQKDGGEKSSYAATGSQFGDGGGAPISIQPPGGARRASDMPNAPGSTPPAVATSAPQYDPSRLGAIPPGSGPNVGGTYPVVIPGQQPGTPTAAQPFPRIPGLPGPFGTPVPTQVQPQPQQPTYPTTPANSQGGGFGGSGYSFGGGSITPAPNQNPVPPPQNVQQPGIQPGSQPGGNVPINPFTGAPQVPAATAPQGIASNPATALIQRMLMTPNPRGLANATASAGGQAIGGGIAGVASKVDAESIKVYKDKTNYKEWEFTYEPQKNQNGPQLPGAGVPQQGTVGAGAHPSPAVPGFPPGKTF